MNINILYDNGASTLPAGFTDGINAAVKYLESHINSNVSFNLHVGFGNTANGGPAEYQNSLTNVNYNDLVSALTSHATSSDDHAAIQSLAATNPLPVGSQIQVAQVEALALGLTAGTPDVHINFNQNFQWDYDASDGVRVNAIDFVAQAVNEITAGMGRAFSNDGVHFQPLQLFDYAKAPAAGQVFHQFDAAKDGYFSLDSGHTEGLHFEHAAGLDHGSWALGQGPDAFDAGLAFGVANPVSTTDLKVMDALGFDLGDSTPVPPPVVPPVTPPSTMPTGADVGTALFSLMSSATPTDAQHSVWSQFASDQLSSYTSMHVGDPALGVWESFGLAFSNQAKFGATFSGMSDAAFAKAAYHDAFGVDPTASQAQFVTDQVHSHAAMYAGAHAYGADNPAVATTLGQGATFGILVGVAEEMGIHTHTIA